MRAPRKLNKRDVEDYASYLLIVLDNFDHRRRTEQRIIDADYREEVFRTGRISTNIDQIWNSHDIYDPVVSCEPISPQEELEPWYAELLERISKQKPTSSH